MSIRERIKKLTDKLPPIIVGSVVQEVLNKNLPEDEFLEEMERRLTHKIK
jgi:hypothetical protein